MGTWFVGVTANTVQSLTAHLINAEIQGSMSFSCWDIPFEFARTCKETLLALEGYHFISDDESDFIDNTYPTAFIYLYQVIDRYTVQHIDTSNFQPVEALPVIPVVVTEVSRDGRKVSMDYGEEFNKTVCKKIVEESRRKFLSGQMKSLTIVHRSGIAMWFEFGEGCCTISYSSGTSQEGYIQSYRSKSRARKLIPFFEGAYPEYMVCKNVDEFTAILQYFLEKDRKPGKRQNVKWVVTKNPAY